MARPHVNDIILEVPRAELPPLTEPLPPPPRWPERPPPPVRLRDRQRSRRLADEIATLFAHLSALKREAFARLREFLEGRCWEDLDMRPTPWMVWRLGCGRSTATEYLRVARALGELPRIDAAFGHGEISYCMVRALTRVATPENEALLLDCAKQSTGDNLEKVCRQIRQQLAALGDPNVEDVIRLAFLNNEDGTVTLEARMRREQAKAVQRAVELRMEEKRAARPAPAPAGEAPALPTQAALNERQRDRVASLVEICERYVDEAKDGVPPGVRNDVRALVKVDLETLRGTRAAGAGECVLGDDTPIPLETARRLLCDSSIVPAIMKGRPGQPLDVGRSRRTVHAALWRALEDRDRGRCQFPGCDAMGYLDAHHIEHWSQGGATKLENLVLLCRQKHHVSVHEGGYSVHVADDGSLVFLDPEGRVVPRGPNLPAVPPGVVERLQARHRAAGIGITPETNLCGRNFDRPYDYAGIVEGVLMRTRAAASFRPELAFDSWTVPPEERRRRIRAAPWFSGLPEEVQRKIG